MGSSPWNTEQPLLCRENNAQLLRGSQALSKSVQVAVWAEGVKLQCLYNARCQEICKFTAPAPVPGAQRAVKPRGQGAVQGVSLALHRLPRRHWSRIHSGHSSQTPGPAHCYCSAPAYDSNGSQQRVFPFINSICWVLLKDSISLI